MNKKLIYLPKIQVHSEKIILESTYFINYIKNVLRFNINQEINISNDGVIYNTIITKINKKLLEFRIISKQEVKKDKKNRIILIQSLFSWPRLEWLIEKTVELGLDEIILVQTQRSKIKISNWNSKKERLDKIMYKALTQSHQSSLVKINEPIKLDNLALSNGIKIIFDTKDKNLTFTPTILNNAEQDIFVAIGPEGGFSREEKEFFYQMGFSGYKMPLPVLRAETAAIAALVLIISKLNEVLNE